MTTTNQNPTARIVGTPKVNKSCAFDGKRWAWVSIDGKIILKAFEGSVLAKKLGVDFSGESFTATDDRVSVEGTLHSLNKNGGRTMHHARVQDVAGLADGLTVFLGIDELPPVIGVAHKVAHCDAVETSSKKESKKSNFWAKLDLEDLESSEPIKSSGSKVWAKLDLDD